MISKALGMSKDYRYKGFTFRRTDTTTTVYAKGERDDFYHEELRNLYEIDGLKERGVRPFLTTISEVREFIDSARSD